jgi:radical SAM superfamily enzyme YgiQ (UPF0313 family)
MKIELIFPALQKRARPLGRSTVPPLGLTLVAALTPPGIDVSLTDENVTPVDLDKDVDLVGISAVTLAAPRAYEIADAYRRRGIPVVLGGVHPTLCPDEAAEHADSIVIGEAEGTWPTLVEDFAAGRLRERYERSERPSLVGLPLPRRDLLAPNRYLFTGTVSTTRGCPFACSFCSVTAFFGHTYRSRPIDEVMAEIDTLKRNRFLFFTDDNIVASPRYAKELFRALVPCRKRWVGQASINIAKEEELLALAAASGCVGLMIGLESVTPASLAAVQKRVNVPDEYGPAIKKIQAHGIAVHGFFIFGFDADEETVFERTIRFCRTVRLNTANFGILMPFPGTSLYESLDAERRILTKDWRQYDDNLVFRPKGMSVDALERGTRWAWQAFYSLPSMWERLGATQRNVLALWAINLYMRWFFIRARNRRRLSPPPALG